VTQELPAAPVVVELQPRGAGSRSSEFEGHSHGVDVSFITVEVGPGDGPALHQHPYPEVFVVLQGNVRFTVGDQQLLASSGHAVIGPPNTRHRFENAGDSVARLLNIHPSSTFRTEWS
jgi:quercetin dioxygenase-like cupin family protein